MPITRSQMALARCSNWGLDGPDAVGGEDGVEGAGELRIAIADEELDRRCLVGELHREVSSLLGDPVDDRRGGDSGDSYETAVVVDEDEHVEPTEEHRVDVEEVARDQTLGLCSEELRPGRSRPPWRWVDTVAFQYRPDAGWGDRDAHGGELAVDATISPGRVLLRQADHEGSGPLDDRGSTRPVVWVGPALGNEVAMPAHQAGRLDEEVPETMAWEQLREPRQYRPIRRIERRSWYLASEDRHLVAEHDYLDREIGVASTEESDDLEDAAERPVEEREGHRWMLAALEPNRQSPAQKGWMTFSAPTC